MATISPWCATCATPAQPILIEGIGFLKDILKRMDRHQAKKFARFGALKSWTRLEI